MLIAKQSEWSTKASPFPCGSAVQTVAKTFPLAGGILRADGNAIDWAMTAASEQRRRHGLRGSTDYRHAGPRAPQIRRARSRKGDGARYLSCKKAVRSGATNAGFNSLQTAIASLAGSEWFT